MVLRGCARVVVMGGIRATTAAAVGVSRLECLKLERQLVHEALCSSSSSPSSSSAVLHEPPARFGSASLRTSRFRSSGARARPHGSRRAHLPALRHDRARAGVRLDAVPQTERQTPQTSGRTAAAHQRPGVSGSLEGEQPVGPDQPRRPRPEEVWTHREKSLTNRDNRHIWTHVEEFWV